jgi:hypothetical protein
LQTIGVSGNRFPIGQVTPRDKIVRFVPGLWKLARYPLGMIDTTEISVGEIVAAVAAVEPKALTPNREVFRFRLSLLRRLPGPLPLDQITELKLDGCGLTTLAFGEMVCLQNVSLAHNEIKASDFATSGLDRLTELKAIDVSHNKIKDSSVIKRLVAKVVSIEALWVVPNPCYPAETPEYRKKMVACRKSPPLRLLEGRPVTTADVK